MLPVGLMQRLPKCETYTQFVLALRDTFGSGKRKRREKSDDDKRDAMTVETAAAACNDATIMGFMWNADWPGSAHTK